ncbi:POLY(ADP-RIBOSE) POLYMERASE 1 [Hibiscus trionum]|uniref:POLY(ADP-RIBOSE) POLYMERASE 1 n=1 Tax=Hibiscus trionum TaxID=183268 RepID=A0A9W7J6J9_HIBTR|nr:POLY(ADP-RIBOSE) POLYMERASE 1 [Hibiscus trionum]
MSQSDAKRLFLEKTGNTWEAWEQKENFQKQPGRFFPLDIDYGVNKQVSQKKHTVTNADSRLPPPLLELVKMLFNVETYRQVVHFTSKLSPLLHSFKLLRCLNDPFLDYRAAMMEFEINMSEMPLGKLSKSNIQKGG